MSRWMYTGVLILSFLMGACTPNDEYTEEAHETQPDHRFMVFVDNGLEAANQGLMELEQKAGAVASETDTAMTRTVAELRSQYQELSEEADSLIASTDAELDEERMELRDRLVNLTRSVEETRLEIIDESDQYREAVKRRFSELDQRMYELNEDINEGGLAAEFDSMMTRLNTLREETAAEIDKLENATSEEVAEARDDVTGALSDFSARLIEAETEYETAAAERTESESVTSDKDAGDDVPGRAAVEPIDEDA